MPDSRIPWSREDRGDYAADAKLELSERLATFGQVASRIARKLTIALIILNRIECAGGRCRLSQTRAG